MSKLLKTFKLFRLGSVSKGKPANSSKPDQLEATPVNAPTIEITAFDSPGSLTSHLVGPKTCAACAPLVSSSGEYVSIHLLRTTNSLKCTNCTVFLTLSKQLFNYEDIETVSTWRGNNGVSALIIRGTDSKEQIAMLAINGEKTDSRLSWIPVLTRSPLARSRERDLAQVRSWMEDCQATHEDCRQIAEPKLPTRVIDVGSSTQEPRLFTPRNGDTGRYLTLSHRWGVHSSAQEGYITTRDNINSRNSLILVESLPKTFRDAIDISRALGVQYLWIDSICIIQNDSQDWDIESAKMGTIFADSYATLFAERAANSEAGIFQTDEERNMKKEWFQEIQCYDPNTRYTYCILASLSSFLTAYPNSPEEAFCSVNAAKSHLQDRGWVMQEEILSRRKICFSETELHWQCNTLSQCECGLRSALRMTTYDLTTNLLKVYDKDSQASGASTRSNSSVRRGIPDLDRSWRKLVEIYTQRNLTVEKDRLPALSGVASRLGLPSKDYNAGTWRQGINAQLLWHSSGPCHRPSQYLAPTWSWASVTGAVHFANFHGNHDVRSFLWEVLEVVCTQSGPNLYGSVSGGHLLVQGDCVPMVVQLVETSASEKVLDDWEKGEYTYMTQDDKTYHLQASVDRGSSSIDVGVENDIIRLDAVEDWAYFLGENTGECSLQDQKHPMLFLVASLDAYSRARVPLRNEFPTGLLIRKSRTGDEAWERVCLMRSSHPWGHWKDLTERKTITLY